MHVNDLSSKLREKVFDAFNDEKIQIGDVTYTEEERAQLKEFYSSLYSYQNWTPETTELATAFLVSVIKTIKEIGQVTSSGTEYIHKLDGSLITP